MRQIDPAGSVFAKPDRVAIRKEATKDDGWATHAMHRLSSLSKKATLVVGIALVVALLATVTPLFLLGLLLVSGITHILINMALFAAGLRRNRF